MFFTYVIQNKDGILYKGHTTDIEARLKQHNEGSIFSRYTKKGREFLKQSLQRDPLLAE